MFINFATDTVNFVASVYGAKAARSTLSTFNKVDRVEFKFIAGVYRDLGKHAVNIKNFKDVQNLMVFTTHVRSVYTGLNIAKSHDIDGSPWR